MKKLLESIKDKVTTILKRQFLKKEIMEGFSLMKESWLLMNKI